MLQSTEYRHFRWAVLFSLVLGFLVALFVFIYGKEHSFLLINQYNNSKLDFIFRYWTYLGDGLIWVPLFLFVLLFRRDYFIAVLAAVLICTILTHFLKRVVFADEFRPVVEMGERIRMIPGYKMNRSYSFPSGHTSTAFTLALLMAYIVRGNFWVFFFPLVAFFVGYSRVYLAQHFLTDVTAGIFIGTISSWLSLMIYERFRKRREESRLREEAELAEENEEET